MEAENNYEKTTVGNSLHNLVQCINYLAELSSITKRNQPNLNRTRGTQYPLPFCHIIMPIQPHPAPFLTLYIASQAPSPILISQPRKQAQSVKDESSTPLWRRFPGSRIKENGRRKSPAGLRGGQNSRSQEQGLGGLQSSDFERN